MCGLTVEKGNRFSMSCILCGWVRAGTLSSDLHSEAFSQCHMVLPKLLITGVNLIESEPSVIYYLSITLHFGHSWNKMYCLRKQWVNPNLAYSLDNPQVGQKVGKLKEIDWKDDRDQFSSVQFSHSVVSDSLWPHESQRARPPCPSPIPRVYSNPCPSGRWCHPAISSSVIPFSSCPQSFPTSGSFPMNQLFASGSQSTGVSASASVLRMNT